MILAAVHQATANQQANDLWSWLIHVGTICFALSAIGALVVGIVKFTPARWVWRRLVSEPIAEANKRQTKTALKELVEEVVVPVMQTKLNQQSADQDRRLVAQLDPIVAQLAEVSSAVNHIEPGEPRLIEQVRAARVEASEVRDRLEANQAENSERFNRVERKQDETHTMIADVMRTQAQTTAAVATMSASLVELVEQHRDDDTPASP